MTSPLAGWLVVVIGSFLPYPAPLHSTPLHLIPVSILINAEVTLLLDTSRKRFFVAVSFVDRYILYTYIVALSILWVSRTLHSTVVSRGRWRNRRTVLRQQWHTMQCTRMATRLIVNQAIIDLIENVSGYTREWIYSPSILLYVRATYVDYIFCPRHIVAGSAGSYSGTSNAMERYPSVA